MASRQPLLQGPPDDGVPEPKLRISQSLMYHARFGSHRGFCRIWKKRPSAEMAELEGVKDAEALKMQIWPS